MLKKIVVLLVILGFSFALMLLTTGESHFEVANHASFPVSQGELWQVLAAVDSWPDWWPGMEEARLVGLLAVGSEIQLRLKGMPTKESALLILVRLQNELVWERSGVFGSLAGTRLILEPDAGGSRLTIENYIRGPQAFLARFTGEDAFVKYQQILLESLKLSLQGKPVVIGEKN
jgi:hypothetical protein